MQNIPKLNLELSKYCNKEITCSCGRVHYCPIEEVVIGNGVLEKIPELLKTYNKIFFVADTNTYGVCGSTVFKLLSDKISATLIYKREGVLVPNKEAVDEFLQKIPKDTDFVLGVGSGVINDICKYSTWKLGLEYTIVATAPSMDGYASSGAAMITKGMKVTYTTHPPKYIVADVDVVRNAPMNMIRSGYGDIIGKYSSLNDWKLSHMINEEYFCQEIYDLVLEMTNDVRDSVEAIVRRENQAIEALIKALVLSGITLSMAGSTRPGSGSEHHLSHFFEIVGLIHGEPHFGHGTDVAYATIVTAAMREQICAMQNPVFQKEDKLIREQEWNRIYGIVAKEVCELQKEAKSYDNELDVKYREHWNEIIEILAECPSAEQCKQMICAVGFEVKAFEAMYGAEKIVDAMIYGKDLKDRYSMLWIYYALFANDREICSKILKENAIAFLE